MSSTTAPRDKDLEDVAAAVMSCLDYYVSSSLVNRPYGQSELAETDVLAIRPTTSGTQTVLVEAKSGTGWGNTELFKVLGQKVFMGADHALFLTSDCDAARALNSDRLFAPHGLHVAHIPTRTSQAQQWDLWNQLASNGLASTAGPPPTRLLTVATRAADNRRQAYGYLRKTAREPGHSTSLPGVARLLTALNDVNLHLANPTARALALWAARDDWRRLPYDLAEEHVQGPGHAGRTPQGEEALAVARRHPEHEPLLRAALQLATDIQLELTLAVTELALQPEPANERLPGNIKYAVRRLKRADVSPALPHVLQHIAWHMGGTINRWELKTIARQLGTNAAGAYEQIDTIANLVGSDWTTVYRARSALTRRNKTRELQLLTGPVLTINTTPGHARTNRWRLTAPNETQLDTIE